jgi:choline monooxygenase
MRFNIDPDIRKAETLPAAFYRDADIFEQLKEQIFYKSWQWLGDISMLPATGFQHPITLLDHFLDEPVLLTRDQEDRMHCLTNVCTHRGNIVSHNPGKSSQLICQYHGRRFDLEGKFKHMPEFKEAVGFPRLCDDLHRFPISQLGPFLWVGLNPAYDMTSIHQEITKRVGFLPLDQFKEVSAYNKDYLVNAHWALYCDNYLEGFHIPFVHADLNEVLDYGQYKTELYDHMNLQIGYSAGAEEVFDLPEDHVDYGKKVAAYYFWIFPNLMLNFYPWGLSVNVIKPLTQDKTKVSFITYVYDESKMNRGAGALLDKVEREDEFVVEGVSKGVKSKYYQAGRFSPTREQGVHQFHQLLAHYVNQ